MFKLFETYFGIKLKGGARHEKIKCIWHDDNDPSLNLNLENGDYYCYGCHKQGNIKDLQEQEKYIEETEVDRLHQMLMDEPNQRKWLYEVKGYTDETIKRWKIGYNGSRFSYPVRNGQGRCVNIKLYSSVVNPKYISYGEGFGSPAFYPFPPKEPKIYLFEGESDTTIARQHGIPAYCQTGGAGAWTDQMTKVLSEKSVTIIYDTDNAGRQGTAKVINAIKFTSAPVKNIILPLPHGMKDFSDWILKCGGSANEFKKIEDDTPAYAIAKVTSALENAETVSLIQASLSCYAFKPIETKVIVAGKDRSPYLVPKKLTLECSPTSKKCATCPNSSGQRNYDIEWRDGTILQFVGIPEEIKASRLKKYCGIPMNCNVKTNVQEFQNIERIAMYPKIELTSMDVSDFADNNTLRRGYFMGSGIMANNSYNIRGIPMPDSVDQTVVIMVVEAEPVKIDKFEGIDMALMEQFRILEDAK